MIHQGRQRPVFSSRRLPRSSVHRPEAATVAPWPRPKRGQPDVMFLARCQDHRHGLRMDAANFGVRLADQKAEDIGSDFAFTCGF